MELLRPNIRELTPYKAESLPYKIKLDIMENPYTLPEDIKSKIKEAIDEISLNRYPDPTASTLKEELSIYTGVSEDMIVVGNGSDELVLYILLTFGKRAIFPTPTFPIYSILSQVTSTEPCPIRLECGFEIDEKAVIAKAKEVPSVVFLPYPNNPTGNCFDRERIFRIIEETESLIVIDEAYYEFSKKSFVRELSSHKNLIILRTFSKAFGLAGIRCGYLIADQKITEKVNKVRLPYNLNVLSQEIALVVLKEREWVEKIVDEIIAEREHLYKELMELSEIEVFPSEANFLFFKGKDPHSIYTQLVKEGILIKETAGGLRVTIGKHDENRAFISALKMVLDKR
jgi:histidinol-phosphate aminotransferase